MPKNLCLKDINPIRPWSLNPFMTEAVIIERFLCDNGLRHERVKDTSVRVVLIWDEVYEAEPG